MNTQVQDVGAEKDAITSLRAPTHFGRPNWDRVFPSIADRHPDTDVGVVSALSSSSTFPKFFLLSPHFPLPSPSIRLSVERPRAVLFIFGTPWLTRACPLFLFWLYSFSVDRPCSPGRCIPCPTSTRTPRARSSSSEKVRFGSLLPSFRYEFLLTKTWAHSSFLQRTSERGIEVGSYRKDC